MLKDSQDAYGHLIHDYLHGQAGLEIVERDDGWIGLSTGPEVYFTQFADWPVHHRQAMDFVAGSVLDLGCGAGRHALYLQQQGYAVLGLDISPLAVAACRQRGLSHVQVKSVTQIQASLGRFDTILMLGNNFGLLSNLKRGRWLLRRWQTLTGPQARIIAESNDIYATTDPDHLAYHAFNRQRQRLPGQIRMRVRYKRYATPWFDYLMVCQAEMKALLAGTGWVVCHFIDSGAATYIAIIEKSVSA
jgi:SAM-dependent methyltransferase